METPVRRHYTPTWMVSVRKTDDPRVGKNVVRQEPPVSLEGMQNGAVASEAVCCIAKFPL